MGGTPGGKLGGIPGGNMPGGPPKPGNPGGNLPGIPGGIPPGPNFGGAAEGAMVLGAGPPSPLTGPAKPGAIAGTPMGGAGIAPLPAALAMPALVELNTGACLLRISCNKSVVSDVL